MAPAETPLFVTIAELLSKRVDPVIVTGPAAVEIGVGAELRAMPEEPPVPLSAMAPPMELRTPPAREIP